MSLNFGSLYPACHSLLQEGTSPLPDKTAGLSLSLRNHLCLLPLGVQYFCIDFFLILTGSKSHLGATDKSGERWSSQSGMVSCCLSGMQCLVGGLWEIKPPSSSAHSAVHLVTGPCFCCSRASCSREPTRREPVITSQSSTLSLLKQAAIFFGCFTEQECYFVKSC